MGDTVNIRLTAEDKIHLQQRMDETGKKATEVFKELEEKYGFYRSI